MQLQICISTTKTLVGELDIDNLGGIIVGSGSEASDAGEGSGASGGVEGGRYADVTLKSVAGQISLGYLIA